ncbi:MAG: DUF1015 domain-containing protein [Candidatus Kapaibacteriota bacterium]|jgi:uncharacterized protein (DUF1015 family)
MAVLKPFVAYRPKPELANLIASKPYDVLNSEEAREEVKGNSLSFLHVGKPEIDLDPSINLYDIQVYEKGKENLWKLINEGNLIADEKANLYIYAQTMNGRTQYGFVGCTSVDDYWNDKIKKHEHTRQVKEEDRCQHVRITNAHTGPIFLTYRDNIELETILNIYAKLTPNIDFTDVYNVRHQAWVISDDTEIANISRLFGEIENLYVADGHHRSAAAGIVGRERQLANPNHNGSEEYNFFLSVVFPASQLYIMDYNRVVKDLNGLSNEEFFEKISKNFTVVKSISQVKPKNKGEFGMYLDNQWYILLAEEELMANDDPIESLDVSILQNYILDNILNIQDPRTDNRIDFVGGIRGLGELEKRVNSGEMKVAFSMHPTSIAELMRIADSGNVMPPKSTWFEPKLKDGMFVHFLD